MQLRKFSTLVILGVAGVSSLASAQEKKDGISFKGDFRYRYQFEDSDASEPEHFNRIRARLGATAKPVENVTAGIMLSTGGASPVSGNVSLGNDFEKKPIHVSEAFLAWEASEALTLIAGKQENPFYMPAGTELIWDSDLRPEGVTLKSENDLGSLKLDAALAGMVIDEALNTGTNLLGAQVGVGMPSDGMGWRLGAGYFSEMRAPIRMLDLNATVNLKVGEQPLALVFDYVNNTEADADNTGWLAGLSYGKLKDAGDLAARYNYRNLEANAVDSDFDDSDFGGAGLKGHEFGVGYGLARNFAAETSVFLAEDIATGVGGTLVHLDFVLKF